MDITELFFDTVAHVGSSLGWPQEKLLKLGPRQGPKPQQQGSFAVQAISVGREITQAMAFLSRNAVDYCRPGRISESERDKIEEEAGLIIKTATGAIESLKRQVTLGDLPQSPPPSLAPPPKGAKATKGTVPQRTKPNEAQIAHRHGILLILSAELQLVVDAFSKLKAQRFREAMEARERREKAVRMVESVVRSAGRAHGDPSAALRDELDAAARAQGAVEDPAATPEQLAVRKAVLAERNSLLQEFGDLTTRVRRAESTLQDISQLSQLLTEQVLTQSHTIELLYRDALAATYNIARGNDQLKKTVETRKSARLYLAVYLLVAALGVLFLDFYHS